MSNPQDVNRKMESTSDVAQVEGMALAPAKVKLLEMKARLAETDEEIGGTLVHLKRLQDRRKDILAEINILTSPILNLPPEITCEIFIRCLPPPRTPPHPRDAPILLGQICRCWRTISHLFPALWSSVDALLEMLETWLIRSGDNHLSVSIVPDAQNWPLLNGPARTPIFTTLRHTSHRWRELEIVRHLQEFSVLLHRDDPWNLPHLVKLTLLLANNGRHPNSFPPNLLSNLIEAPALREVHLMGFTPSNLLLPWSQLTTVYAENLLPIECLLTLAATTNIITGAFSIWAERFFHLPNPTPVVRPPHLTSLTIVGEQCTELLDHMELPAIEKISLSIGLNNNFAPLCAFVTRHAAMKLKEVELEIRGAITQRADFISILEAMTGIETLSFGLHTGLMNGPLPWALLSNAALLPNMRALTIRERLDRYNEPPLHEEDVVNMLATRWAGGEGTLKKFCLVTTHVFVKGAMHPGFDALAKEGMHVDIRSHGSGPFLCCVF
ncbi:F-box domain-containing protein [Mycena sanguinolenta]|uniref:F-box domain-containing protein n=1 Tax=Mycena sanguinolenta TaxID=230812 RepID=A0A8H7D3E9_9AGAR|nr:F-box domain-containing protein [Mycena sanguinolenta]